MSSRKTTCIALPLPAIAAVTTIAAAAALAVVAAFGDVRQQRHLARPLDRLLNLALVAATGAA